MTAVTVQPDLPSDQRLPWSFVASALVTFAALYISGKFFVVMPVLGVLLIGSYLLPWRLPESKVLGWVVRIAVWVIILSISPRRHTTGMSLGYSGSILYEPDYVHLFGYLAAAELVLRAWIPAPGGPSRGDALLLSALVFAAASNTTERAAIHILAPIYAVFTIVCLRTFDRSPRRTGEAAPAAPMRPRRPLVLLRLVAAFAAVFLAFTAVTLVTRYEYALTSLAMRFTRTTPRNQDRIGLSTAPFLTAAFNPQASMNRVLLIDGPYADRHLRAMAFDTYQDGRWLPPLSDRDFHAVSPPDLRRDGNGHRLRFTPLVNTLDLLLLPLETTSVGTEESLVRDRLGVLRTQSSSPLETTYQAVVPGHHDAQGPLCIEPDVALRQRLLAIPPEVEPAVLSLARDVAKSGEAPSRIENIRRHLQTHHRYSLTFGFADDRDPISDFILNGRSAHCQYFASAVVIMARAVGVPSRYVSGYYAHELYGKNQTVVRDRDGHAWAECYLDGIGWVTIDATPDAGLPQQLFDPPSRLRRLWERLQDLPAQIRQGFARITLRSAVTLTALPLTLLMVVWLVRLIRMPRKMKTDLRAYAPPNEHLAVAARRFEAVLTHLGHPCAPNRTWREHLSHLPAEAALDRDSFIRFVNAYDSARFGAPDETAVAETLDVLQELEVTPAHDSTARLS